MENDEAIVRIGTMHIRVPVHDLLLFKYDKEFSTSSVNSLLASSRRAQIGSSSGKNRKINRGKEKSRPGFELDIRGKRADEAVDILMDYLDKAFLEGYPFVRIIHGKGTGRLREVVREELKSHPYVKSFQTGQENEGGDGVTVAFLDS